MPAGGVSLPPRSFPKERSVLLFFNFNSRARLPCCSSRREGPQQTIPLAFFLVYGKTPSLDTEDFPLRNRRLLHRTAMFVSCSPPRRHFSRFRKVFLLAFGSSFPLPPGPRAVRGDFPPQIGFGLLLPFCKPILSFWTFVRPQLAAQQTPV